MEKNRNLLVLISLIVIVLLFRYSGFLGSLFAPEDDYVIFDDFSEGVFSLPNSDTSSYAVYSYWNDDYRFDYVMDNAYYGVTPQLPLIENEKLLVKGYARSFQPSKGAWIPTVTIKKDIKRIDFKFDLAVAFQGEIGQEGAIYANIGIKLNDINTHSVSIPLQQNMVYDTFTVETKSHLLDKNLIDVYVKGVYINTFNITDEEINLKIVSSFGGAYGTNLYMLLDNIKFRVKFNCEISPDEMLVTEIYNSGETIQMDNKQRVSPDGCIVESFCRKHPAFIITSTGSTSDEGDEIYESMTDGYSLTVPEGETWQLFFIAKKTATGRCEGYTVPPSYFEPVAIETVTDPLTIYPGKFKTFETKNIVLTDNMPQTLKATFLIKAVAGGLEQTKDEVIVFER